MMHILKLFLNDPWLTQINDVGHSFSDYLGAEAKYTSAFLSHIGKYAIAVFAVAAIMGSICIGLFIGGTISLVLISAIYFPQISGASILASLVGALVIFLLGAIALQAWLMKRLRAVFREYQTHWTQ